MKKYIVELVRQSFQTLLPQSCLALRDAVVTGIPDPPAAEAGTNRFRPRYAVNVRVLDGNGQPDERFGEFESLPLPDTGVYRFPEPGTIVAIAFVNGSPDRPHIVSVSTERRSVPALQPGEAVISHSYDSFIKFAANGDIGVQTNGKITEDAFAKEQTIETVTETIGSRKTVVAQDDALETAGSMIREASHYSRTAAGDANIVTLQNEQRLTVGEKSEGVGSLKTAVAQGEEKRVVAGGVRITMAQGDYELATVLGKVQAGNGRADFGPDETGLFDFKNSGADMKSCLHQICDEISRIP